MNGRLTARQTAERQARIVELRLSRPDLTWKQIADLTDCNESTCRRAYQAWRASDEAKLTTVPALELVHEQLAAMRALRGQLGALAAQTNDGKCEKCHELCGHVQNESVLLGSLKSMAVLIEKEIALMQSTSILPNDLGLIRVQMDVRYITEAFIAIFDKYVPPGVHEEAEEELIAVLRKELPSGREKVGVDAGDEDEDF